MNPEFTALLKGRFQNMVNQHGTSDSAGAALGISGARVRALYGTSADNATNVPTVAHFLVLAQAINDRSVFDWLGDLVSPAHTVEPLTEALEANHAIAELCRALGDGSTDLKVRRDLTLKVIRESQDILTSLDRQVH